MVKGTRLIYVSPTQNTELECVYISSREVDEVTVVSAVTTSGMLFEAPKSQFKRKACKGCKTCTCGKV